MQSIVGVAGGATRAALTQHQALKDNMADVSAKDGSQVCTYKTVVYFACLCTRHVMLLNMFCLSSHNRRQWSTSQLSWSVWY